MGEFGRLHPSWKVDEVGVRESLLRVSEPAAAHSIHTHTFPQNARLTYISPILPPDSQHPPRLSDHPITESMVVNNYMRTYI